MYEDTDCDEWQCEYCGNFNENDTCLCLHCDADYEPEPEHEHDDTEDYYNHSWNSENQPEFPDDTPLGLQYGGYEDGD